MSCPGTLESIVVEFVVNLTYTVVNFHCPIFVVNINSAVNSLLNLQP